MPLLILKKKPKFSCHKWQAFYYLFAVGFSDINNQNIVLDNMHITMFEPKEYSINGHSQHMETSNMIVEYTQICSSLTEFSKKISAPLS